MRPKQKLTLCDQRAQHAFRAASSPTVYLSHNGRELGLMLRGTKPLAYFLNVVASEFDFNIRYWRIFDGHVAAGRLIRREVSWGQELPEIILSVTGPRVAD